MSEFCLIAQYCIELQTVSVHHCGTHHSFWHTNTARMHIGLLFWVGSTWLCFLRHLAYKNRLQ